MKFDKSSEDRIAVCGKYWNQYAGKVSSLDYLWRIRCYQQLCPHCNSKGGAIHRRRKKSESDRLVKYYGSLDGLGVREFVYTLPESLRPLFSTKEGLDKLLKMVGKLIKPLFPGRLVDLSLHVIGNDPGTMHIHVNAYVFERILPGFNFWLSAGFLKEMKSEFRKKLLKYGFRGEDVVVDYHFKTKLPKVLGAVKYFTRPNPDYSELMVMKEKNNKAFKFLTSKEMRKFNYIRHLKSEVAADQYIEGDAPLKFEKMKYVGRFKMSWEVFITQYRSWERIEVRPDCFVVRSGGLTLEDYNGLIEAKEKGGGRDG